MNKPWQVCLVLIAIFAAGGISGGLVAYRVARRHAPPPPEVWVARQIEHVARELQLTPEQKEHIQPIVKRTTEELGKLRRQSMPAVHSILERMETDIAEQLTPEQRTKFEQILKQRREARKQMQGQRGPHGARERPPGPPPGEKPPPASPETSGPPPPASNPGDKPVGT
jgi:Spy/CpxP family protein refolding chaperone